MRVHNLFEYKLRDGREIRSKHASGLQQPEAKAAWDKMESLGWAQSAPGDSERKIIDPQQLVRS